MGRNSQSSISKGVLALAVLLSAPIGAKAQNETIGQINAIKRDTAYLYAEATMPEWQQAYDGASDILEATITDWANSQAFGKNASAYVAKAKNSTLKIKTKRGKYFRAFLYVKKSDIVAVDKSQTVMVVSPVKKKKALTVTSVGDKGKTSIQHTPVGLESTVEEINVPSLTEEEKQMVAVRIFSEIQPLVKKLQSEGVIDQYGKYSTIPSTGTCYLFVYDKTGKVSAVLKRADGTYTNLATATADDINNYKNHGAIWLSIK